MDITNSYMEGRMEHSKLCFHGRSKEKRDDCKIVVLAAVVNTDGLLVRTMIYEGNRQDVTTVREVVGSLAAETSPDARKIVVMDAGFYSAENARWLVENYFDYITVLPSGYAKFTADSDKVVRHEDCRHQEIRLQMGRVEIEGVQHRALLVDSDAKALKEQSMHDQACKHYEEGLEAIRAGITKKGGTKGRDAVNARLGRLYKQYGAIRKEYDVTLTYEGKGKKEKAVAMEWKYLQTKLETYQIMQETYRIQIRIDTVTYAMLVVTAQRYGTNRTKIVLYSLKRLVHEIQTGREPKDSYTQRFFHTNDRTRRVLQIRVPIIIIDYLRLNQLNITTCILTSIRRYATDYEPTDE